MSSFSFLLGDVSQKCRGMTNETEFLSEFAQINEGVLSGPFHEDFSQLTFVPLRVLTDDVISGAGVCCQAVVNGSNTQT